MAAPPQDDARHEALLFYMIWAIVGVAIATIVLCHAYRVRKAFKEAEFDTDEDEPSDDVHEGQAVQFAPHEQKWILKQVRMRQQLEMYSKARAWLDANRHLAALASAAGMGRKPKRQKKSARQTGVLPT